MSETFPVGIIASVQVGQPVRRVTARGQKWESAIGKAPVSGPVFIGPTNLDGDRQANLKYHGGPDKVVCVYFSANYPGWREEFGRELPFGAFGENLTVAGLSEAEVCVGDTLTVGGAVLQISQPRMPCINVARRWEISALPRRMEETGRTGLYCRVEQTGQVAAENDFAVIARPFPEWTMLRANQLLYGAAPDPAEVAALRDVPLLSGEWKRALGRKLRKLAGESDEDAYKRVQSSMALSLLTSVAAVPLALLIIGFILLEGFETLVLPRRIERPLRLTGIFYRTLWANWRRLSHLIRPDNRDNFLSFFGPLSLLLLLTAWASGLIFAFALFQWGSHAPIRAPEGNLTFSTYLYLSATTFITLGFGDVTPITNAARIVTDIEAGTGFGFLAIVIGYFPVLYGAFSRREVEIALLDARASSPPSAGEMLRRVAVCPELGDLLEMLRSYERWSAELLESHLSYPVLMYYRSQHDRQSWLSALTSVLDACAFLVACQPEGRTGWQARMTFAMARHAAVDLAHTFDTPPHFPATDRLPPERFAELCALLREAGMEHRGGQDGTEARLTELRRLYEPFVNAISQVLVLPLPSWMPNPNLPDNWQTSAWDRSDHFFQNESPAAVGSRFQ